MRLKSTTLNLTLSLLVVWIIPIIDASDAFNAIEQSMAKPRQEEDPVLGFRIVHPRNGSVVTLPLTVKCQMDIKSIQRYTAFYARMQACIEMQEVVAQCTPVLDAAFEFHNLPEGEHTTRIFITDDDGVVRHRVTAQTTFSIINAKGYEEHAAFLVEQSRESLHLPKDASLLEWAKERWEDLAEPETIDLSANGTEPAFLIGIKTAVLTNFARRQAIRDTWANDAAKYGAKVFFLGCSPSMRGMHDERRRGYVQNAIDLEKKIYGDLLTEELECEDAYGLLAEKVTAFFHLVAAEFTQTPYVMIADDDIYLRVDKLSQLLHQKGKEKRMYMGQRWSSIFTRASAPVREVSHRNYVSKYQYPMNNFLPYAFGPHYVVSMDCVRFISRNYWRLQSLNGLEDVSVGFWLLMMQVHLQHIQQFAHLTLQSCKNDLISFAELSPLGIRIIHSNLRKGREFCTGFDRLTWNHYKPQSGIQMILAFPTPRHKLHHLQLDVDTSIIPSGNLQVTVSISAPANAGIAISYYPPVNTFTSYLWSLYVEAKQNLPSVVAKATYFDFATVVKAKIRDCFGHLDQEGLVDIPRTELWRYNLFQADAAKSALIVAYAPSASYSRILLECLFASVFEAEMRPLLVIPVDLLHQHYGVQPDVLVFSSLGKCSPASKPECKAMVAEYFQRYNTIGTTATSVGSTQLVMVSGEAWSTDGLDERVLLISTLTNANRAKHIYLSMASISFAERLDHGPLSLLSPLETENAAPKTKFCAYLFSHCEHSNREIMYDTLNALRPVDALGKCAGSSRPPDYTKLASRETTFYNDDAVQQYAPFKFVIAFENTRATGYVTEKLVNAFLAGSVPVYWGDSKTVSELFNPKSFIDCDRFESLQSCAEYVVYVDDSPEMYSRMRQEAPVTNMTAFNEAFSWHPTVSNRFMADEVLQHLHS